MSVIDQTEKKVIIVTGFVLALFIFSVLYARGKNNDLPECVPFDKTYPQPKVTKLDNKTYQVYAVAAMWRFEPSQIYIPAGSEVYFFISCYDVLRDLNTLPTQLS